MEVIKICDLLSTLNNEKPSEYTGDIFDLLERNVKIVQDQCNVDWNQIKIERLSKTPIDSYLALTIHLLNQLKSSLVDSNDGIGVLSVQQNKIIRDVLKELIDIGIRFNLQPKLPQRLKPPSSFYVREAKELTTDYNRLCFTTKALIDDLFECDVLRALVVFVGFESILNALYQIIYCPLKKPQEQQNDTDKSGITTEMYQNFMADKQAFKVLLEKCATLLPKSVYVKETMLLLKSDCVWLKRTVSLRLTDLLRSKYGLRTITNALLANSRDYDASDSAKSWQALDVIVKLITSLKDAPDFESNICKQITGLLDANTSAASNNGSNQSASSSSTSANVTGTNALGPYESIFMSCTKLFYKSDRNLCQRQFLGVLFKPLDRFVGGGEHKFENNDEDVTDSLQQTMRLLRLAFANRSISEADLPYDELTPYFVIVFRQYASLINAERNERINCLLENMLELLLHVVLNEAEVKEIFDAALFGLNATGKCKLFRSDVALKVANDRVQITLDPQYDNVDCAHLMDTLLKLLRTTPRTKTKRDSIKCQMKFFIYLLDCLANKENYSRSAGGGNRGADGDGVIEKNLLVYSVLSALAEDADVQRHINDNPNEIVAYIAAMLDAAVERNVHKSAECETTDFQTTFLLIMILQALTASQSRAPRAPDNGEHRDLSARVLHPLRRIQAECINHELSTLVTSVINALEQHDRDASPDSDTKVSRPSELDKAIDEVCDPLLPIRGHGLMTLAKLIEEQHPDALDRKLYILNVFQQNIKNDDSFIYLAAINGLALMGNLFPDVVLETITDEYTGNSVDFSATANTTAAINKHLEIRMKLGEVLVKVTRNLGDKAVKYKTLLINAFMLGSRDDDHLMRASSLSNLGEICRVLGYKLGAIVTDVLDCIHAVITSDPSVEARRAAVTVIRQLFVGLEAETIVFLRDDIADVYRTLRRIYYEDEDDVMRLQAQLALEELDINIRAFIFPKLPSNCNQSARNELEES